MTPLQNRAAEGRGGSSTAALVRSGPVRHDGARVVLRSQLCVEDGSDTTEETAFQEQDLEDVSESPLAQSCD